MRTIQHTIISLIACSLSFLPLTANGNRLAISGGNSPIHAIRDTSDIMNDYDPETERETSPSGLNDRYRGRSKWSSEQFSSYVDSVGIENRTGQSAAVAAIITSMKQGNMQGARSRLQKLMATPGYMLDPDVAQMLVALDVLLQRDANASKMAATALRQNRIDTVYRTDTVFRDVPRVDTVRIPAPEPERSLASQAPEHDTIYVDVVKYDTIYVDRKDSTDPMRDLAGNAIPEPSEQPMQKNESLSPDDAKLAGKLDILTDEVLRLRKELRKRNEKLDEAVVTRRCYTIHIASYTTRDSAEKVVRRLKQTYKRTRLAIANDQPQPYSVIVGYYETIRAATVDAEMVSKSTGRQCRPVMTTIAEQL